MIYSAHHEHKTQFPLDAFKYIACVMICLFVLLSLLLYLGSDGEVLHFV